MTKIYSNQIKNKAFRKELRENQTKAERFLWFALRKNNLEYKFRRQFGIGNYIVDFYCHKLKLIIEIDGQDHDYRFEEDVERQNYLEKQGFKIIRYTNHQVTKYLENVFDDIKKTCDERVVELKLAKPLPTLPS